MLQKSIIAAVFGLTVGSVCLAQEVSATAGGYFESSQGQVSFTVGETVIETIGSVQNTLTQGFHQSKLTVVGINEPLKEISVKIFPNPTSEIANIEFDGLRAQDFNLLMFDVNGSVINAFPTQSGENTLQIDLRNVAAGTYFLHVKSNSQKAQFNTYRIVKTH